MNIKYEQLRCLVSVCEYGSLSAAGEMLSKTPSALSMTLRQLEEELGKPIFQTERKNKLTPFGMFVLTQAKQQVRQFEGMIGAISSFASADRGFIRIAAIPSISQGLMPVIYRYLSETKPGIRLELQDMDSRSVIGMVETERVDIGIASHPSHLDGMYSGLLTKDRYGVVVPEGHPLTLIERPLEWMDIMDYPFISHGLIEKSKIEILRDLDKTARLRVLNTTSLKAMIIGGAGITLLPELSYVMCTAELVFMEIAPDLPLRTIYLLLHANSYANPSTRVVTEIIRKAIELDIKTPEKMVDTNMKV